MSLWQNEEFLIFQLRSSYLIENKDGVGERLISIDSAAILNDPSIRAAGWTAHADIKRTYSPPIPTATAVSSDYFSAPVHTAGFSSLGFGDEDEEGGMVTGRGGTDTVGPGPTVRRRRRREQQEEDDSSDLSDESDDPNDGTQRAAQQIKFAKMPVRTRAGSSPIRGSLLKDGPEVLITSPRRSTEDRSRRGSMGAVEAVKQRARRDTTTSSDMSSENELDPSLFRRRQIGRPRPNRASGFLQDQHEEDEEDERVQLEDVREDHNEDSAAESDDTSLSSDFGETAVSGSLLNGVKSPMGSADLPLGLTINPPSPRKVRNVPSSNVLQALPPPRPISTIQPISALGQAIRARQAKPKNPIEIFARFSGKGALDPLNIRIYAPFSESPDKPYDLPLQKTAQDIDSGAPTQVKVADAIGFCLWRYHEEGLKPVINRKTLDVNRWTLRIVDDGEVEYDFPALNRVSNVVDFTSNNNRPVRGRSRGKPYDEFALVEATEAQYRENLKSTPKYTRLFEASANEPNETPAQILTQPGSESAVSDDLPLNTTINKPFAFAGRKQSASLADRPAIPTVHSTPRTGPTKMLKIHFTSLEAHYQTNTIEVTTDTYIAEVLDIVCKRWNLDKAHHFLKVSGTNTVAPLDRTVESIGARNDLDLMRRRFAHDGSRGIAGSPGSSSPNAPLMLMPETPRKGKKATANAAHPLSQNQDVYGNTANYKKYIVVRKQPMSFTPSHSRTLLMDGDYMHILPGETGKTLFDTSAKTTTVPFSMIVGCKVSRRHPKTLRVLVFRERETKRYDFEAQTVGEAADIVNEIRRGMEPFQGGMNLA